MTAVAIHETVPVGGAPVAEQDHHLVQAFRVQAPEIPHHGRALEIGLRIPFLGMNEIRELFRVFNKKYRGIVSHQIPVAVIGIKLDGKTARVSFSISASLLTSDGGETHKDTALVACTAEQFCTCIPGNVAGNRESAKRPCAFGMNHTLGDTLTVKMR